MAVIRCRIPPTHIGGAGRAILNVAGALAAGQAGDADTTDDRPEPAYLADYARPVSIRHCAPLPPLAFYVQTSRRHTRRAMTSQVRARRSIT